MPPLVNWHRFDGWAVSQVNWLAPRLWSGPGEPFIDAEDCVLIGTKEVYGVVHPSAGSKDLPLPPGLQKSKTPMVMRWLAVGTRPARAVCAHSLTCVRALSDTAPTSHAFAQARYKKEKREMIVGYRRELEEKVWPQIRSPCACQSIAAHVHPSNRTI